TIPISVFNVYPNSRRERYPHPHYGRQGSKGPALLLNNIYSTAEHERTQSMSVPMPRSAPNLFSSRFKTAKILCSNGFTDTNDRSIRPLSKRAFFLCSGLAPHE